MKVKITIPGKPTPKGRPRFSRKTGRTYTPVDTGRYEKLVRECYGDNYFFDKEFIKIKVVAKFAIPQSYSKKKREDALSGKLFPTKCDLDNIVKSITDGLNGKAYADDRYIYKIEAEKIFTDKDETIVEISSAKKEDLIWINLI